MARNEALNLKVTDKRMVKLAAKLQNKTLSAFVEEQARDALANEFNYDAYVDFVETVNLSLDELITSKSNEEKKYFIALKEAILEDDSMLAKVFTKNYGGINDEK